MTGIWLVLLKAEVLFFAIGAVVVLIAGIVNIAIEYRERKQNAAEPEEKKDILETAITEQTGGGIVTECSASKRCAAAVLRDMKESTKDGAFVQVGAYWYEVQDLTKSIEAIKEAIEEAENEEAG